MPIDHVKSDCDQQRLRGYLDQELTADQEAELEAHLDQCPHCRELIRESAAEEHWWAAASAYLKRDNLNEIAEPCSNRPGRPPTAHMDVSDHVVLRQIREWLDPTDDPKYIGRFGGYEIMGVVGCGGMGVVLKGFEPPLNRYVAIKVLSPALAASGAARQRFAREAQAAAAVLHENVIAIHRVDESHGLPYLVMPFVSGVSLQRRIDTDGPLPLTAILRIGRQIAAGLAAAHAQGLVHRDIKPANILLDRGVERVTITDFGLARAADDGSLTKTGVIAGTPQYMSPEQSRGEALDARSDLFSLGSVLYAMCAGHPPFRAETGYGILRRITDTEPRPVREINPEIPEWFEAIIRRLHAKNPDERFQSAAEVAELLEECLAHVQQPTVVPLPDRISIQKQREISTDRTKILRKGVLAMIATVAVGLLGLFLWQSTDPPDVSGGWTGEDWGQVVLKETHSGRYEGTYTRQVGDEGGQIDLKWSRLEGRFNGTWREGDDRQGKISLRLVDDQLRGAWTTSNKSRGNPETPKLADLLWSRRIEPAPRKASEFVPKKKAATAPDATEQDDAVRREADRLAGVWKLESWTDNGKERDDGRAGTLTFRGNQVRILINPGSDEDVQKKPFRYFSVNPEKSPAEINLYDTNFLVQGIYKLEGDTLTLAAFARSEVGRPRGFTVAEAKPDREKTGVLCVLTFRRQNGSEAAAPDHAPASDPAPARKAEPFTMYVEDISKAVEQLGMTLVHTESTPHPANPLRIRGKNGTALMRRPTRNYPVFIELPQTTEHFQWTADDESGVVGNGKDAFTHIRVDWIDSGIVWRCYGPLPSFGDEAAASFDSTGNKPGGGGLPPEPDSSKRSAPRQSSDEGADDSFPLGEAPRLLRKLSIDVKGDDVIVACSLDGKLLAVANGNPTQVLQTDGSRGVKNSWQPATVILDAESGKTVASLKLSTDEEDALLGATPTISHFEVTALGFSPDGKLLAVGTSIGQAKLFNAQTGALVQSLDDEQEKRANGKSPDGWKQLRRAMGSVRSLAFSPDGSLLAVCGGSFADFADLFDGTSTLGRKVAGPGRLKVFDITTGSLKHNLAGHSHAEAVAFSHDGSLLASAGQWAGDHGDGAGVIVWNHETGETIPIKANGGAHAVALSRDEKMVVIGSRNFDRENDTSTTTIAAVYPASRIYKWQRVIPGVAHPKAFTPDGDSVLVLCPGRSIQILDADTGETRHEIDAADSDPADSTSAPREWSDLAVASETQHIAVAGNDAMGRAFVEIWSLGAMADRATQAEGTSPAAAPAAAAGPRPRAHPVRVLFDAPAGMLVAAADAGGLFSHPLKVPAGLDLAPSKTYRLKITNLPGREGTELYPIAEIGPTMPRTDAFLAHNAIPVRFTDEDFDQVLSGNLLTKVIYLPDPDFPGLASTGVETLASTRLDPSADPIVEAKRRGSILAVIRLGTKDADPPSATPAAKLPEAQADTRFDITGVILSDQKTPLADADVLLLETYIHAEKLHAKTRTDREGKFTLKGVPQGKEKERLWRYTLAVSAPSFASRVVFVPYAQKEPIHFELVLSAPAALRGRVVDADGSPVAGAMVWTPPLKQFIGGVHSATTDASGHFQIGDLAPWNSAAEDAANKAGDNGWSGGKAVLRVHHPDHGRMAADYDQVPATLSIRFERPMRVSGRVFDRQSGFPVAGATVRAGTVAGATDAEGRYQLFVQPLENLSVHAKKGAAKSQYIALKGMAASAVTLSDLYLRLPQPPRTGESEAREDDREPAIATAAGEPQDDQPADGRANGSVVPGTRVPTLPNVDGVTVRDILAFEPEASGIDFDRPTEGEIEACRVVLESGEAWTLLDRNLVLLRRFVDKNRDGVVDLWAYYKSGQEVYREADTDYDGAIDYREGVDDSSNPPPAGSGNGPADQPGSSERPTGLPSEAEQDPTVEGETESPKIDADDNPMRDQDDPKEDLDAIEEAAVKFRRDLNGR